MKLKWNPAERPRSSSALREVADQLARANSSQALPMDRRVREELQLDALLCLKTFLAGHGNYETWGVIVKNLNMAMILTEFGYGEEWLPTIKDAMAGAFRAQLREKKTGRWGFDGPAAYAIGETLRMHDVQLELASKAHVLRALVTMNERLAAGEVYSDADAQS